MYCLGSFVAGGNRIVRLRRQQATVEIIPGGWGLAHVVNPRGDLKSVNWSDDGASLRVLLSPAKGQPLTNIKDYKFYVTGGITGLTLNSVQAYDLDGNVVTGVSATIEQGN